MGIMIANELSYYPTPLTDEELALTKYASEQKQHATTHELNQPQTGEDIITSLGTTALSAITGGIAETYRPSIEQQPASHETQRELGAIAMELILKNQFDDTFTTATAYKPSEHELADRAYLLATQSTVIDTARALELAGRQL